MYYEEKFINGKLMFRMNPNDKWRDKQNAYAIVANDVHALDNVMMIVNAKMRIGRMGNRCEHGLKKSECYVCMSPISEKRCDMEIKEEVIELRRTLENAYSHIQYQDYNDSLSSIIESLALLAVIEGEIKRSEDPSTTKQSD